MAKSSRDEAAGKIHARARAKTAAKEERSKPSSEAPEPKFNLASDLFQLAVEASPAAMLMVDARGKIELVNAECERMFGYLRQELIGASIDILVPAHIRNSHHGFRAGFAAEPLKRQMGVGRDLRAVRRDGSEFPVEIGLTPVNHVDGFGVLAVVVDITARREAEKKIDEKMIELERANASLAHFAFVASHDIQEPLRKIVTFAEILGQAIKEDNPEDMQMASNVMLTAALRARALVTDMLTLARSMNQAYEFESISIDEVVETAVHNLSQAILDSGAEVETRVDPLRVKGDRHQIVQLVQNIIENALKYRKTGHAPKVQITVVASDAKAGRMQIRDDGIGFPASRSGEIFEPFKRLHTREEYSGSGLGLAICRAIADRHGWKVSAKSEPDAGSCFEIVFSRDSARA